MAGKRGKPIILITGAAGNLGKTLAGALSDGYRVVGLDHDAEGADFPLIKADLTSDESLTEAMAIFRRRYGRRIASVIHLAAYFDFTGEDNPLYGSLNVEGVRRLLRALQDFEVEQFVYASTMLVHAPCRPGEHIDEAWPIGPRWDYPRSKAAGEAAVRAERGTIPTVILRLAGVYDEAVQVPTLAQQIARIYARDFESHLYAGDPAVGQAMLHKADMVDAFRRTVDRRTRLPKLTTLLIGEPDAPGYGALQDALGRLIHGEADWPTLSAPAEVAAAGAWLQQALEPVVPDAFDQGDKPFIRPFMALMANDHYALDVEQARRRLGWTPKHSLAEALPAIVGRLKADPLAWSEANGVTPPAWMRPAREAGLEPEAVRRRFAEQSAGRHRASRWAHFANIGLASWLIAEPFAVGVSGPLGQSQVLSGAALLLFSAFALSRQLWPARWICAVIGLWIASAPMIFWTSSAAAYHGDTLVAALVIAFAIGLPPEPGVSPLAATSGPTIPPGWDYSPSDWSQRLPIVVLAVIGLHISGTLAAYQLGQIDGLWDPFFAGGSPRQNGTEQIVTSEVSKAWPVSDAAVGGVTYLLEVVTGVIGSRARWRTMPWLVIVFGLMIVPLGVVSIGFIIIQPIVIGTWCTLCLIAAAAMLVQIPYSIDELVATGQFLARRKRAGQSILRSLILGDTDEGRGEAAEDEFERPLRAIMRETFEGGVGLPWTLAAAAGVGLWLMLTRITLGAEGGMADADHLIGSLTLTVVAIACSEPARAARFLLAPLGLALLATPFIHQVGATATIASLACGAALIVLAIPRGRIRGRYGSWDRWVV